MAVRHNAELEENIKKSDYFIVLLTEAYLNDALCTVQYELANQYKRHFVILAKPNVKIPPEFLKGIKGGYKIIRFEDMRKAKRRLNNYMQTKSKKQVISTPYQENPHV